MTMTVAQPEVTSLVTREEWAGLPRYLDQHERLIRLTYGPNLNDNEWQLFREVCVVRRLNPVAGQITAFHINDRVSFSPTIQGRRVIAQRTGDYAGADEIEYSGEARSNGVIHPLVARATVYRFVRGERCAFTGTARWSERAPTGPSLPRTSWGRQPYVMLGKCAETAALSRGFPEDFEGFVEEPTGPADADDPVRATPGVTVEIPPPRKAQLHERLSPQEQQALSAAALERGVMGIKDYTPDQPPPVQRWLEIARAIGSAYEARGLGTPPYRVLPNGEFPVGEMIAALLAIEPVSEAAGADEGAVEYDE